MKKLIALSILMALVVVPVFADDVTEDDATVTITMTVEKYVSVTMTPDSTAVTATGGNGTLAPIAITIAWETNCDADIDFTVNDFTNDSTGATAGIIETFATGTVSIDHSVDGPIGSIVRDLIIDFGTTAEAGAYTGTIDADIIAASE